MQPLYCRSLADWLHQSPEDYSSVWGLLGSLKFPVSSCPTLLPQARWWSRPPHLIVVSPPCPLPPNCVLMNSQPLYLPSVLLGSPI